MRDYRWVKKTKNLEVGDIVWLIQDPKLSRRLKWAIVKSVHLDHDGVVRDAIVRYALLKPGPEPYVTGFNKRGPFKTKLVSVQNQAMMYSCDEQREDMEKFGLVKSGGSAMVLACEGLMGEGRGMALLSTVHCFTSGSSAL